jgi:hypothetical protein
VTPVFWTSWIDLAHTAVAVPSCLASFRAPTLLEGAVKRKVSVRKLGVPTTMATLGETLVVLSHSRVRSKGSRVCQPD